MENGNKIVGSKRGTITTDDDVVIEADSFVYEKTTNNLAANGNVILIDKVNNYKFFSEEINYNKTEEIISPRGDTKSEIKSDI